MLLNRSADVNSCDLGVQLCKFCENLFELVSNLELRLQRDLMDDDLMTLTIDPESNIKKSEVQLKTNQLWSVDNEFVFRQSVQHEDNHVPVSLSKKKRKAAASFHDAVSLEGPRCSSVMLWRSVITRQPWPCGRNIFSTDQHIAKLMIHTIRNVGVVAHIDAGAHLHPSQSLWCQYFLQSTLGRHVLYTLHVLISV